MIHGYARVSTDLQSLAAQEAALAAAGCAVIHRDPGVSGGQATRPGLDAALRALQPGDTLVVTRLDRLGRSLGHLIALLAALGERGIGFRSLAEAIDTTTAGGRLIFHLMGALAEFERALIAERTRAGMAAARAAGQPLGRRRALSPSQLDHARALVAAGRPVAEIARLLRVSRSTLYRRLPPDGHDRATRLAPSGIVKD